MSEDPVAFYNDLAEHYHLIYDNWDLAIERQAAVLVPLLEERVGPGPLRVLDCACGIGTQTVGIALRGHTVVACDPSEAAVRRAERETHRRGLDVKFAVVDMRALSGLPAGDFDVVLAADNALPHLLSDEDLSRALKNILALLNSRGIFAASVRDYDRLLQIRPAIQGPTFYSDNGKRRVVHQVWDWHGDEYTVHLYLTCDGGSSWVAKHYVTRYRAIRQSELVEMLGASGFDGMEWLTPESTGYFQPIIIARKGPQPNSRRAAHGQPG